MTRPTPSSSLFPYTTLFRSIRKWILQPAAGPIVRYAGASPSAVLRICPMAIWGRPTEGSMSSKAVIAAVPMSPAATARVPFMLPPRNPALRRRAPVADSPDVGRDHEHLRLGNAAWTWHHDGSRQPVIDSIDDAVEAPVKVAPCRAHEGGRDRTTLQPVAVTGGTGSPAVKDLPARIDDGRRQ